MPNEVCVFVKCNDNMVFEIDIKLKELSGN